MDAVELNQIVRAIKSLCPAQKWDEHSPDLWLQVLRDVRFQDATAAVERLATRQPWIGTSDITRVVKEIRSERLERVTEVVPNEVDGVPPHLELQALNRAIADGRIADDEQARAYSRWGGSLFVQEQRGQLQASARTVRGELA